MSQTKITLKFSETIFRLNGIANYVASAMTDNSTQEESGQGFIFARVRKNGAKGHISAELFDADDVLLTEVHLTGERNVFDGLAGIFLWSKDDQASGELISEGHYAPAPGQSGVILLGISGNMSAGSPRTIGRTGAFPIPSNGLDVTYHGKGMVQVFIPWLAVAV